MDEEKRVNANGYDEIGAEPIRTGSQFPDNKPPTEKWYKKTWFTVVMLIFFWPVGLVLMWVNKKFNMVARVIISVICGFILIGMITNPTSTKTTTTTSSTTQTTASQPSATVAPTTTPEPTPDVPTEYKSALKKAKSYSDSMHMSKQGIYDQLTSEYGEKFSAEAGQYAVDNLVADYNYNALQKAKTYQSTMSMSPDAIWDQLTSEFGEKFTPEEADYAISNLP